LNTRTPALGWGHINVNVSDLDASVAFYEKLGFSVFLPAIPYLGLTMGRDPAPIPDASAEALGLRPGARGRACIMQLDEGFPKLDLTELADHPEVSARTPGGPLQTMDRGLVRFCLFSTDLAGDHARLAAAGIDFLTPPRSCPDRLADIALCRDPDGTLIELIQVYLENWTLPAPEQD